MKINIRVVANARKERIIKEDSKLKVYVNAPALEGKANKAVINLLADYYNVRKSAVEITSGLKSKEKTIQIRQ